jgi:hypothetical protein
MKNNTVGRLREQSALQDADTPIILVSKSPELNAMLKVLKVVRVYPDLNILENGAVSVFKIEIASKDYEEVSSFDLG